MTGSDIPSPTDPPAHPLVGHEARERLRVRLSDGHIVDGHYAPAGHMHFLHRTGPGLPLLGEVVGPLLAEEIASVEVLMTRAEVLEHARELLQGPRVHGREPVTREDFEHRLRTLARVIAEVPKEDWSLRMRLRRQFEACADRIKLGSGKRAWLLAEVAWSRRSNVTPTMADLWGEPVASPSCFARPRPQDFDPDPAIRRRRAPWPPHVRADPFSLANMRAALIQRGLRARVTRLGDPPWGRGHIQVEMPVKGRARFVLMGEWAGGQMAWECRWDGNESKAGLMRRRKAEGTEAYRHMLDAVKHGRREIQFELLAGREKDEEAAATSVGARQG